jgi:cytochrome c
VYAEPFEVRGNGEHTVRYRSIDGDGNVEETRELAFRIADTAAPTTTARLDGDRRGEHSFRGPVTVTLSASDGPRGHGVERTEYRLDGGAWRTYTAPFVVTGRGRHVVQFRSLDGTGNLEPAKGVSFNIADGPR